MPLKEGSSQDVIGCPDPGLGKCPSGPEPPSASQAPWRRIPMGWSLGASTSLHPDLTITVGSRWVGSGLFPLAAGAPVCNASKNGVTFLERVLKSLVKNRLVNQLGRALLVQSLSTDHSGMVMSDFYRLKPLRGAYRSDRGGGSQGNYACIPSPTPRAQGSLEPHA
ncbi:hypothetical protein EAI_02714 [Harpegnathos saltator]|uniref:Uncharacterized protein n=1 Tax=Harpegnathos saltator TaxID=610380 RepID=E2CA70_HARSA|nr:hypothetical protein EAI_02714 [Harpegnathos saltator]